MSFKVQITKVRVQSNVCAKIQWWLFLKPKLKTRVLNECDYTMVILFLKPNPETYTVVLNAELLKESDVWYIVAYNSSHALDFRVL